MIREKNIIKEGNPKLRLVSSKVELPIKENDLNTLKEMLKYLDMSQDEELSKKYKLNPGVGLAAPQIGINKRMFAVKDNDFNFGFINPEIIKESKALVYLGTGEGCLSVPNKNGLVLRHKVIEVKSLVYDPKDESIKDISLRLEGYDAIVFQHEFDHLNGTLFIDKITQDTKDAEII